MLIKAYYKCQCSFVIPSNFRDLLWLMLTSLFCTGLARAGLGTSEFTTEGKAHLKHYKIFQSLTYILSRDKTMAGKLMYISNDVTQNYPFCRLKFGAETFGHLT